MWDFEVLTPVSMKMAVFRVVMPFTDVSGVLTAFIIALMCD
jgi:hypothetical protein